MGGALHRHVERWLAQRGIRFLRLVKVSVARVGPYGRVYAAARRKSSPNRQALSLFAMNGGIVNRRGMVDRIQRDRLAKAIRRLAAGLITTDEFAAATTAFGSSPDTAVRSVYRVACALYDDLRVQRLAGDHGLGKGGRRQVARWIVFLRSDLEYEWPDLTTWRWWLLVLPNLLTFGAVGALVRRWHDQRGEAGAWPFIRSADLARAAQVWPAHSP